MTGESSLTAALEAHVSCQVVLQRVSLPTGGTLESLIFRVAGILRARSNRCVDLRGPGLPVVNRESFPGTKALVKIWKTTFMRWLVHNARNENRTTIFSLFYVLWSPVGDLGTVSLANRVILKYRYSALKKDILRNATCTWSYLRKCDISCTVSRELL